MKHDHRGASKASLPEPLPAGFIFRVKGDTALIVRKEYEASRPLAGTLTGVSGPAQKGWEALSGGRGSAVSVSLPGIGTVVLRRYRRGGLLGKVLIDRYLFGSRPFRELTVLALARSRGVPVPEVLGASSTRVDLFWHRGRIVTRLIPDSQTLPLFIEEKRNDVRGVEEVLRKTGQAVRRMHDAGIDHADLNMNNILVDARHDVFIIDFDKATVRPTLGQPGRIRNLKRLLRSLRKLREAGSPLEDSDFSMIVEGYAEGGPAPGGEAQDLRDKTLQSRSLMLRSALGRALRRLFGGS
jgi:3-deoxy-D-manno-octulosonic acid kinase